MKRWYFLYNSGKEWCLGGSHVNYLLRLSSYFNIATVVCDFCILCCSQPVHEKFCASGCFAIIHTVSNLQLLYNGNFKACNTTFNPGVLHLSHITDF